MNTYLVLKVNNSTIRMTCTSNCPKPRMKVSNSYIPLTTKTDRGTNLIISDNGVKYRAAKYTTESTYNTTTSSVKGSMYDTTALTAKSTTGYDYKISEKGAVTSANTNGMYSGTAPLYQKKTTRYTGKTSEAGGVTRYNNSAGMYDVYVAGYTYTGSTGFEAMGAHGTAYKYNQSPSNPMYGTYTYTMTTYGNPINRTVVWNGTSTARKEGRGNNYTYSFAGNWGTTEAWSTFAASYETLTQAISTLYKGMTSASKTVEGTASAWNWYETYAYTINSITAYSGYTSKSKIQSGTKIPAGGYDAVARTMSITTGYKGKTSSSGTIWR